MLRGHAEFAVGQRTNRALQAVAPRVVPVRGFPQRLMSASGRDCGVRFAEALMAAMGRQQTCFGGESLANSDDEQNFVCDQLKAKYALKFSCCVRDNRDDVQNR